MVMLRFAAAARFRILIIRGLDSSEPHLDAIRAPERPITVMDADDDASKTRFGADVGNHERRPVRITFTAVPANSRKTLCHIAPASSDGRSSSVP